MKVHLIVLQHGLWGTPYNLEELELEIEKRSCEAIVARGGKMNSKVSKDGLPTEVRIFNSHSSFFVRESSSATMDGIDTCGERLFDCVKGHIEMLRELEGEEVTHISMVGYSLGGLITRYAVGKMETEGWFDEGKFTPINFMTIATPHLGVWKNPSKSWLFATCWNYFVPRMASITGQQLTYKDQDHGSRPLLINLSDPGLPFFQGLKRFTNRITSANIHNDLGVPYWTSSITVDDPYEVTRRFLKGSKSLPVDPDNYPSIRKPYPTEDLEDHDSLPQLTPDQPPLNGSKFAITFLCLLPVFSPLIAYALIRFSVKGINHCQKLMKERPEPPSSAWLRDYKPAVSCKEPLIISPEVTIQSEGTHRGYSSLATDDVTVNISPMAEKTEELVMLTSKPLEHIGWMSEKLNMLKWNKIDVDCREGHAHAGIVVRMKHFKIRDHLRYMVQQMEF